MNIKTNAEITGLSITEEPIAAPGKPRANLSFTIPGISIWFLATLATAKAVEINGILFRRVVEKGPKRKRK